MADVRINALATTATSAASDDYLALDGSANGTRKILATNVAQNVTDVTFGTSGPSAKSSLAARAARQGLVFNGTQVPIATSISTIGTGDYSWAAYVTNKAIPTVASFVAGINDSATDFGGNRCALRTLADGTMDLLVAGVATSLGAADTKTNLWVVTRSGTTLTVYKNGVSVTTTTDSQTYGSSYFRMGGYATSNALWQGGVISAIYPYNRALSAAEVVSLYEAGVPNGADYNSASNTNLATSTVSASGGTLSGESATGFTMTSASGVVYVATRPTFGATSTGLAGVAPVGSRWLVTFTATLTSGAAPSLAMMQTNSFAAISNAATVTAGANSIVLTTTSAGTWVVAPTFYTVGASTYTISSIVVTRLGLLLAPDAAQAGGGLVWYDTSGNAANITLPASGVTWNVPSSAKTASGWTFGGAINATGTSVLTAGYWRTKPTADDGTLTGLSLANSGGAQVGVVDVNTLTGDIRVGGTNSSYPLALYSKSVAVMTFGASSAATLAGNLTVSGTGTSSFAGPTTIRATSAAAFTPLATSALEINLPYISRIAFGENSAGSANPAITLYRTTAGAAQGTAIRLFQPNATGEFYIQKGTTDAVYGTETYTTNLAIASSGNVLLGTTTDTSGKLQITNTASTASYQTGLRLTSAVASAPNTVQSLEFYSSSLGVALAAVDALRESGSYASSLRFWSTTGPGTLTEGARLTSGGNLLLGTTTDSGNGKLQLASHTTSAGGIGFGTDTSLFRVTAGYLYLDSTATALYGFSIGGVRKAYAQWINATGSFEVGAEAAGSQTKIFSSGTTALTLDSSQRTIAASSINSGNGVFAGKKVVTVSALNTDYGITSSALSCVVVVRDDTTGGSALWLLDPNQGAVSISSNLTKTITFTYGAGIWTIKQTAGSVATNYSFGFFCASSVTA